MTNSPDAPKQTVRVTIFNQAYTLSTAGDAAQTEELARQIDDLMSSIARRAGNLDSARTAVLACLHLADRLRTVEAELEELRASVDRKTRSFASLLDEALTVSEAQVPLSAGLETPGERS
ncbi:MAG TPA: cell division protein ZapA [Bryobacteraceae bacterium]|jgi:cell division protein ZapA|nr:cell division protein ZapA [Bryobacteraceae bacterium]